MKIMLENKTKLGQEPAFPMDFSHEGYRMELGISKRSYMATMALQGLCANPKNTKIGSNIFVRIIQLFLPKINIKSTTGNCSDMVSIAYDMADELLKQENLPE